MCAALDGQPEDRCFVAVPSTHTPVHWKLAPDYYSGVQPRLREGYTIRRHMYPDHAATDARIVDQIDIARGPSRIRRVPRAPRSPAPAAGTLHVRLLTGTFLNRGPYPVER